MNESALKSALAREIKRAFPGWVLLGHEDVRTPGIPDKSLTGAGTTSWWEFKYAEPYFKSRGIQEHVCRRLAKAGTCRYAVWARDPDGGNERTLIVRPDRLAGTRRLSGSRRDARDLDAVAEKSFVGFDLEILAAFMAQFHSVPREDR